MVHQEINALIVAIPPTNPANPRVTGGNCPDIYNFTFLGKIDSFVYKNVTNLRAVLGGLWYTTVVFHTPINTIEGDHRIH